MVSTTSDCDYRYHDEEFYQSKNRLPASFWRGVPTVAPAGKAAGVLEFEKELKHPGLHLRVYVSVFHFFLLSFDFE